MYFGKQMFAFNRFLEAHKSLSSIKFNIQTANRLHSAFENDIENQHFTSTIMLKITLFIFDDIPAT